ncbi:MAG: deoxyribonuclease V [Acidobacteriota bacterium]
MKVPRSPHPWSVTPRQAVAIQRKLAARVRQTRPRNALRLIAGMDVAFTPDGRHSVAAVVVWDRKTRSVVEEKVATRRLRFPYVPGLLSFREAPAVLAALRRLRQSPDALMCDGHGLAHPRRFGLACHIGILCNLPTLGCAKQRLIGKHSTPEATRGSRTALKDRGQTIGTVLRTQDGVRPVFVSIGHKIDTSTAEALVLDCAFRYRLPEPTRLADRLAAQAKRRGVGSFTLPGSSPTPAETAVPPLQHPGQGEIPPVRQGRRRLER